LLLVVGMVNNTSIDWYMPWPEQALYAVASVFIAPDVRCNRYLLTATVICYALYDISVVRNGVTIAYMVCA